MSIGFDCFHIKCTYCVWMQTGEGTAITVHVCKKTDITIMVWLKIVQGINQFIFVQVCWGHEIVCGGKKERKYINHNSFKF